jgi:hypothetical protein
MSTTARSASRGHLIGVARPFGLFGGGGDVREHAAEDDAVERRDGPPVRVTCEPRGRKIARWW